MPSNQRLINCFSLPLLFTDSFFSPQDQSDLNSTVIKSPTNTVVIRGLKPGSIYVFQVRARTVAGFGRYSGKLYFQTMTEGENSVSGAVIASCVWPIDTPRSRIWGQTAVGRKPPKDSKFRLAGLGIKTSH